MILTGSEISKEVKNGKIVIEPFDEACIDPNSYSFHIGDEIMEYRLSEKGYLDVKDNIEFEKIKIGQEGFILEPGKLYLASTYEKMGSNDYAKSLLANFSTSSMGMWIQFSAPLGHMGAIINWTLEIMVAQKIRIYPFIRIGRLAFWDVLGDPLIYHGKYTDSEAVICSKIMEDFAANQIE